MLYMVDGSQELTSKITSLSTDSGVEILKGKHPYTKVSKQAIVSKNNLGLCEFISIETLVHLNNWIKYSMPMISQFITIVNSKDNSTVTVNSLLGNDIEKIIKNNTNINYDIKKVVKRDLLCGESVYNLLVPLNKTTSTLIILGDNMQEFEENPCIKCGKCYKACEMKLIPFKLDQYARKNEKDEFIKYGGQTCIECGLCSYVCPSKRKLMESIIMMKKMSI